MSELSISIDGPTASGKTTLGTRLADRLGAAFLDTGLTFRVIAYALARDDLRPDVDWRSVVEHRPRVHSARASGGESHEAVLYHGKDVTSEIWEAGLDTHLRVISSDPSWRFGILNLHREIAASHRRLVAVGRDVATTLLPAAKLNVYLTASLAVRRERRRAQYRTQPSRSVAVGEATRRDQENRSAIGSMPNALEIDSTYLPAVAVLSQALRRLGVTS